MRGAAIAHRFVQAVPEKLEPDTLYVSLDYLTTSHLCACGCGAEVVLPLHPTKWRVTFDGAAVSMHPSVGSRALPCRSHYWIDSGRVRWAGRMTERDFERALARDQRADSVWHGRDLPPEDADADAGADDRPKGAEKPPAPAEIAPASAPASRSMVVRVLGYIRRRLDRSQDR